MQNDEPIVTVCVPTFNAEKTIKKTLDSILSQDFAGKMEILVCDNSSSDSSPSIIQDFTIKYKNIRYIVNPIIKTAEDNWNYVLSFVNTEVLCLYHADDLYSKEIIRAQFELIIGNDVGAVFTMSEVIDENDNILNDYPGWVELPEEICEKITINFETLFNVILKYNNCIKTPTLMTKKSILNKVGNFNTKFKSSADLDLWLRIAKIKNIGIINKKLHKYRISKDQGSIKLNKLRTELSDYHYVMDYYLANPNVKKDISNKFLKYYFLDKAADSILCGINLIKLGNVPLGKKIIKENSRFLYLIQSFLNNRNIKRIAVGNVLNVAFSLGLGEIFVDFIIFLYNRKWKLYT